jgi:hypothetical protein
VVGHLSGLEVEGGVQRRVRLQRIHRCFGEERQVGQLHPLAGEEVGLRGVTQPRDVGDIDLEDLRQLRGTLQGLDHALGNDLAQPAHRLGLAAQRAR